MSKREFFAHMDELMKVMPQDQLLERTAEASELRMETWRMEAMIQKLHRKVARRDRVIDELEDDVMVLSDIIEDMELRIRALTDGLRAAETWASVIEVESRHVRKDVFND
jgi:uncharacterized coiled-coil protein SlyX